MACEGPSDGRPGNCHSSRHARTHIWHRDPMSNRTVAHVHRELIFSENKGEERGSVADVESAEVAARLRPCDLDRVDARVRLGRLVPVDACLDSGTIPFEDRFDTSIVYVAHIAVEAEALGFLRAIRSKVDALDATAKDHDRARLHRFMH